MQWKAVNRVIACIVLMVSLCLLLNTYSPEIVPLNKSCSCFDTFKVQPFKRNLLFSLSEPYIYWSDVFSFRKHISMKLYKYFFSSLLNSKILIIKVIPHWLQHLAWNWFHCFWKTLVKWKWNKAKANTVGGFWANKFSIKTHVQSVYLSYFSLNYAVENSLDFVFITLAS